MLVDEAQAIELPSGQARDACRHLTILFDVFCPVRAVHGVIPELSNAVLGTAQYPARISVSLRDHKDSAKSRISGELPTLQTASLETSIGVLAPWCRIDLSARSPKDHDCCCE
jgi:hypothetical protein